MEARNRLPKLALLLDELDPVDEVENVIYERKYREFIKCLVVIRDADPALYRQYSRYVNRHIEVNK